MRDAMGAEDFMAAHDALSHKPPEFYEHHSQQPNPRLPVRHNQLGRSCRRLLREGVFQRHFFGDLLLVGLMIRGYAWERTR